MIGEMTLESRGSQGHLPLDSDIGLRSPCDGLLAKRRKLMREMNKKSDSFISENIPKDLSTKGFRPELDLLR